MKTAGIKAFVENYTVKLCVLIITIIGAIVTIYSVLGDRKPKFEYEILSRTTIFDKTEEISSLQIFFDNLDVQKNDANISIFTIKVINNGLNIAPNMYDGEFGLFVNNGYIIENPIVIKASTMHIKWRLEESLVSQNYNFINIPNIALDNKDYYIIKVGVIHHNDSIPDFLGIGKIVGQKDIYVKYVSREEKFYVTAFKGGLLVQSLRLMVYWNLLALIFLLWTFIDDLRTKRKNKKGKEAYR